MTVTDSDTGRPSESSSLARQSHLNASESLPVRTVAGGLQPHTTQAGPAAAGGSETTGSGDIRRTGNLKSRSASGTFLLVPAQPAQAAAVTLPCGPGPASHSDSPGGLGLLCISGDVTGRVRVTQPAREQRAGDAQAHRGLGNYVRAILINRYNLSSTASTLYIMALRYPGLLNSAIRTLGPAPDRQRRDRSCHWHSFKF